MPLYGYRCTDCGNKFDQWSTIADYDPGAPVSCIHCHGACVRAYEPITHRMPMADHYNVSAGQYVSGEKELRDVFKRKSDEATERTGIPHNFVPVDLRDTDRVGVKDAEGLGATQDRRQSEGKPKLDLSAIDS